MFTSFAQYMLLSPAFTNIINVCVLVSLFCTRRALLTRVARRSYAFCNIQVRFPLGPPRPSRPSRVPC